MYLHKLGQYLTYYLGRTGTPIDGVGPPAAGEEVWKRFRGAFGVPAGAAWTTLCGSHPSGSSRSTASSTTCRRNFLGVRSDDVLFRFILAFTGDSMVGHHDFRPGVDKEAADAAWPRGSRRCSRERTVSRRGS